MPTDPLLTLTLATGGAFLGKFVGPAAEGLGKAAWERAQQLAAKATTYLTAVGREPQPVEPKVLLPLVQAASLETDPLLTDLWAALLANAADPIQQVMMHPSFSNVLSHLTSLEAQLLAALATIQPEYQRPHLKDYIPKARLQKQFEAVPEQAFAIAISSLTRQELCVSASSQPVVNSQLLAPPPNLNSLGPGTAHLQLTPFGHAFLAAVTPPLFY